MNKQLSSSGFFKDYKQFKIALSLLFIVGSISRLAPIFNQDNRLFQQWVTEDGYLMLTIARNIALGRGMSIAEGTIPTNGTQPLFNFIEAASFAVVGGDRTLGIAIILILQLIISVIAAGFLFLLARQVLQHRANKTEMAALAAVTWYSSSSVLPHTMNYLETGLYITLILISFYVWYRDEISFQRNHFSWSVIGIGLLLGLTFWARIDAVFFIFAITFLHTLLGLWQTKQQFLRRLKESFLMGITSLIVASPWLIYNQVNFGSIMPISGTAQSANTAFASNLPEIPATLFEYAVVVLPIPNSLEKQPLILFFSSAIVLAYLAIAVVIAKKMNRQEKILLSFSATLTLFLFVYYGLLFGAPHFVSRYLFPISPFLAIFTAVLIFQTLKKLGEILNIRQIVFGGMLAILALTITLNFRLYAIGNNHMHFQVVNWVEENVAQETWVGAIQTGTLGFFHERTINLDGKVNPAALSARIESKIPEYVVFQEFNEQGERIDYLVDWVGIADWATREPLNTEFELIVEDQAKNLAVLKRKDHG